MMLKETLIAIALGIAGAGLAALGVVLGVLALTNGREDRGAAGDVRRGNRPRLSAASRCLP